MKQYPSQTFYRKDSFPPILMVVTGIALFVVAVGVQIFFLAH